MVRLVHENSGRDLALAAVGDRLQAFAAHLLRIIAGGGNAYRMMLAWRDLNAALDEWPDGELLPSQHELRAILDPEIEPDEYHDDFLEQAVTGALRLVASRYQRLLTQERLAESQILTAVNRRDALLQERRRQLPQQSRSNQRAFREAVERVEISTLTPAMFHALSFIGAMSIEDRRKAQCPAATTLKALIRRKMAAPDREGVLGHRLTRLGRKALKEHERSAE